MSRQDKMNAWLANTLALARDHRKNCKDDGCNVSLLLLRDMAENAGVEFPEGTMQEFM